MQTIKYKEILETLGGLDDWLAERGIAPKNDRVHAAIDVVRQAQLAYEKLRATGQPTRIGNVENYYFGMVEALEFRDIFTAFANESADVIGPKLGRALSGPLRPQDETKENTDGRNTMFELALAAEWRLRGLDAQVGDPDIVLTLHGVPFYVECKRPYDSTGIRSNVRGAAAQLREKLDRDGAEHAVGIIAVSVTRVFNRGDKLFVTPTEAGREKLGDHLEQLMKENERHWGKAELHPRIAAVLFHIATPAVLEDRDLLVRMTFTAVKAVGREGPTLHVLRELLPRVY